MITIYTDGSSKNNKGKDSCAGVAFYIPSTDTLKSRHIHGTNSAAELTAVDYALWYCKEVVHEDRVHIFTDSIYVMNILDKGFNYKANVKLIEQIKEKINTFKEVKFTHVDAHKGVEYNEKVDKAARAATARCNKK